MATLAARDGFDTALTGTPPDQWLQILRHQPAWSPQGAPLIVVSPHPDDETLGAGGLIASYAGRSRPVIVVSVTDGEAAYPDWQGLGAVRRAELKSALHRLSPHMVLLTRLGMPDGAVQRHEAALARFLSGLITPGSLLVGPYEHDGHPDHDAVGRVCVAVAAARNVVLARYPIWTWHQAQPDSLGEAKWGRFELDVEARQCKQRAIEVFVSQLRPASRKAIVPEHVLPYFERNYEAFLL
jgi:LmbE family N-acetylglucosaminyl deacetylase